MGFQLAVDDPSVDGVSTLRTRLRPLSGVGLFGRGLLSKPTGHALAHLMSSLLNRGEVEVEHLIIGAEDLAGDLRDENLETRVDGACSGRGAEHEGLP
jgi:hypothetical protein